MFGSCLWPRSYLYVPGTEARKLAKACSRGADAIIVDLEDSVIEERKSEARETVRVWLAAIEEVRSPGTEIWIRVNRGEAGVGDLRAVYCPALTGVCLPKVSGPDDIAAIEVTLLELATDAGRSSTQFAIQPLIESAAGVLSAATIARVAGVRCLQLGEIDLGADLGVEESTDGMAFLLARSQLVLVSAAAGINPPVGPVDVDFIDLERFRASTVALRRLGYGSRACIHPAQVAIVNEVFTPSIAELERARKLVEASERAEAEGSGVWRDVSGRMADLASARASRRLLHDQR